MEAGCHTVVEVIATKCAGCSGNTWIVLLHSS